MHLLIYMIVSPKEKKSRIIWVKFWLNFMLDINNNKSPKLEVSLNGNFPFYISIWNFDYIFVALDSVPKSLEIAKDNIIERCN